MIEFQASIDTNNFPLIYCSKCFKKYCPRLIDEESLVARFFVPTLDSLYRNHFAYVELSRKMVDIIYSINDRFSIDLSEIGRVLHIEIGEMPTNARKEEVEFFYSFNTSMHQRKSFYARTATTMN